jgi:isoleucyl-tRNA synthetase
MKRVPEVIDCWFDSGSMPFAQWHYPFENKELFESQFPANFISEGVDQTRGWFYSLMAISTLIFDCAPYKNVLVLGHVLDKDGQKMSKSKGNAVDPFEALEAYGADAIRWYFYSNSAPWLPNRFFGDAVIEGQRKFMGTLWNTYAFYVLYANIDGFNPMEYKLDKASLSVMDRWILSKLNSAVKLVDNYLANYKITEATRVLEGFVDELSNWYVRRSRERFWVKDMPTDKVNAYMTLYTSLVTIAKISAPMIPFMAEEIYRNLVSSIDKDAPISIHLCDFPEADESLIDKKLEENMDEVVDVVVLGRACRNAANIKNRQPIGKMYVKAENAPDEEYVEVIADELNVKSVEFTDSVRAFTTYSFKPQLRTVGPKYGKYLGAIRNILATIDGNAAMDELEANGAIKLDIPDADVSLTKEDLLIEMTRTEGFESLSDNGITVVIDKNLTPELIEEGFVREIISKIQTMRKDSGFEVMDRIRVAFSGNEAVLAIALRNAEEIKDETLADTLSEGTLTFAKEWNINGEKVTLSVEKV